MADRTEAEQPAGATLHAAISHAVVGLLREYTGRGPMKSRTTIRDNVVLVMLDQTLTKGEQSLVNKGRGDKVIEIRHEFQEAMREESIAEVAQLTGRPVVAMLTANHVDPTSAPKSTCSMDHPITSGCPSPRPPAAPKDLRRTPTRTLPPSDGVGSRDRFHVVDSQQRVIRLATEESSG